MPHETCRSARDIGPAAHPGMRAASRSGQSTRFRLRFGSKARTAGAAFAVPGPRSFSKTLPSWAIGGGRGGGMGQAAVDDARVVGRHIDPLGIGGGIKIVSSSAHRLLLGGRPESDGTDRFPARSSRGVPEFFSWARNASPGFRAQSGFSIIMASTAGTLTGALTRGSRPGRSPGGWSRPSAPAGTCSTPSGLKPGGSAGRPQAPGAAAVRRANPIRMLLGFSACGRPGSWVLPVGLPLPTSRPQGAAKRPGGPRAYLSRRVILVPCSPIPAINPFWSKKNA